jgi:hypothetical protein
VPNFIFEDQIEKAAVALLKGVVMDALNAELPDSYDRVLFQVVSTRAYDLIYDYAAKGLKWAA